MSQLKNKIEHLHRGKYQHLIGQRIELTNQREWSKRWGNFGVWAIKCECKIMAVYESEKEIKISAAILHLDKDFPEDKHLAKYEQKQRNDPPDLDVGDVVYANLNQCRFLNPNSL